MPRRKKVRLVSKLKRNKPEEHSPPAIDFWTEARKPFEGSWQDCEARFLALLAEAKKGPEFIYLLTILRSDFRRNMSLDMALARRLTKQEFPRSVWESIRDHSWADSPTKELATLRGKLVPLTVNDFEGQVQPTYPRGHI